jgi:general secretion pathway protein A
MKKGIILFLFFSLCFQAFSFGEKPSAQKYFDRATTQYLVGDLNAALKSINLALKIKRSFRAAIKLKQSIMREGNLREMGLIEADPLASNEVLSPVASLASKEVRPKAAPLATVINYRIVWFGFFLGISVIFLAILVIFVRRIFVSKIEIEEEEEEGGLKILQSISEEQKLWYKKLNWGKNPFTLDVHPELFTGYEKEVKEVLGKINAHSGHILITGPLGIGKTTFLRWLANNLPKKEYHTVYIPRPSIEFNQLIQHIFQSLGYSHDQAKKESNFYELTQLRKKAKKYLILLLDEAHEFTTEIERPLRTLGDIDGVNLVMVGLLETIDKLKNEIKPLYDRLILKITLDHLEFEELKELIKMRVNSVGGMGTHPLTAAALEKVYQISKGNPRTAIKLCDNAVTQAIDRGEEIIGPEIINLDNETCRV